MAKHQDPRRDNPEHPVQSPQNRHPNDPYAAQQHAHFTQGQQQADHRPQPDRQQGGYPDNRGQQGSYGTAPENRYGNSHTNTYARNPGGSPGMGEPWRDEPSYGGDSRHDLGNSTEDSRNRGELSSPPFPHGQSQYSGGTYRGYREQGGYPAEQYPQAWGQNPGSQRSRGQEGWNEDHHSRFDPHYLQWRNEQIRQLDEDYRAWRTENYDRFSSEFNEWRKNRLLNQQREKATGSDDTGKQGIGPQSQGLSGNK